MNTTIADIEVSKIEPDRITLSVWLFDGTTRQVVLLEEDHFRISAEVALYEPHVKIPEDKWNIPDVTC